MENDFGQLSKTTTFKCTQGASITSYDFFNSVGALVSDTTPTSGRYTSRVVGNDVFMDISGTVIGDEDPKFQCSLGFPSSPEVPLLVEGKYIFMKFI